MNKNELCLYISLVLTTLTACSKAPEPLPIKEVAVSGYNISFPAGSATVQRLLTASVISAQDSMLSLPARLVWDEDHTSRITSPIAGRVNEIVAQTGSWVSRNQPLAYLSSPELGIAQTESARAQAELAQAERNYSRIKDLLATNGVAGKDLEQTQLDLVRARTEAERTTLHLKSLGAGNIVDLRYTLRSPIAGEVVERNANFGMEWRPDQPGAPLFVVTDPSYLWCWIDAPENLLNTLHAGMNVVLRASAWPQQTFKATIDFVSDALDPSSRTIKVRARLLNPSHHLKGEMYVTAEFASQAHGMLDVPAKAVFLNNGEQQVFIKTADGQYTRKSIVPVSANDQWVSIAQGLHKGDEIVVDGALYLQKILDEHSQPEETVVMQTATVNQSVK